MKVLSAMFYKEMPPGGTSGAIQGGVLHPYRQLREKSSAELSSSASSLYITQNTDSMPSPLKDENSTFEMATKKHCENLEYYCHYCHTEHYCY